MLTLFLAVGIALVISAACSTSETVIYSVTWAYAERMRKSGSKIGKKIFELRSQIDKPIAAVLTLNTIANTTGSAIAGAAFVSVYGSEHLWVFALLFTIVILLFGEIIPKLIGVAHANSLVGVLIFPLFIIVQIFMPIIWLSGKISRMVTPANSGPNASEDDIRAIASLSRQSGGIQPFEEKTIRNILSLDRKKVRDIMTPRTVVFSLPASMNAGEACTLPQTWNFSRIPIYGKDNEDIIGMVERRILMKCIAEDGDHILLSDVMSPLEFVLESVFLDKVLQRFLDSRIHIFGALDEYGGLAGVVTLEDVLEEILGREIVDECDYAPDLQAIARQKMTLMK